MLGDPVEHKNAQSFAQGASKCLERALAKEVPVALVYDGSSHAVMMASPIDLVDLAYGFSLSEGIITDPSEIEHYEEIYHENGIELQMRLKTDRREQLEERRRFIAGPVGCGLCGIESLEAANRALPTLTISDFFLSEHEVLGATDLLRAHQRLHDQTHAVHAAGFLLPRQGIHLAREDVGRHNAVDKLIGALARADIPASKGALVITSRISVELVQKCALAGISTLIAVSAPTAYALRLAEDAGITLIASARGQKFDLFSHSHRIKKEVSDVA